MRELIIIGIICIYLTNCQTKTAPNDRCAELEKMKCIQTEYRSYIKCLEKQRIKREVCPLTNTPPQTSNQCIGNSCNAPTQCTTPSCNSCVNTCTASCSGNACMDRCSISCQASQPQITQQTVQPQRQIIQQQPPPLHPILIQTPSQSQPSFNPNVTTIIKLTNIVNNTNVVNVPTTINNTNINNLELDTGTSANLSHNERCCMVVQPKTCQRVHKPDNSTVYRCIHRKHHTCGEVCSSQTVHAQVRQSCNGSPSTCPPSVAYVPQPNPRCIYQQHWPYVSCGNAQNYNCEGCYDHYGYGFERYHGSMNPGCGGCFDDGYDLGALYRQGPYYRQGYYHTPPHYMLEQQPMIQQPVIQQSIMQQPIVQQPIVEPMSCGINGCFGNELIDPAFGVPSYNPYASMPPPYHYHTIMHPNYYQPQYVIPQPTIYPQINYPAAYPATYIDENEIIVSNSTLGDNDNPLDENSIIPLNSTVKIYPLPPQPRYVLPFNMVNPFNFRNSTVAKKKK